MKSTRFTGQLVVSARSLEQYGCSGRPSLRCAPIRRAETIQEPDARRRGSIGPFTSHDETKAYSDAECEREKGVYLPNATEPAATCE
jgi:hypothetical protein